MISILNYIIATLPILILGYTIVNKLRPSLHKLERITLGWLSGVGIFSVAFFLANLQGFAYTRINGLSLLVILILATTLIKPNKEKQINYNKPGLSLLALPIILTIITIITNLYLPVRQWDSLALYEFRAVSLANTGFMDEAISSGYFFAHPPLTSIFHTWIYVNHISSPMLFYSSIYIALLVSFYFAVLKNRSHLVASLFTSLLAVSYAIYSHAFISYTNLPYTTYLVIGILFLSKALINKRNSSQNMLLSAIFIGLSTWIRSSEPFWLIPVIAAVIINFRRKAFKDLAYYVGITFGMSYAWSIFRKAHLGGAQGVFGKSALVFGTIANDNLSFEKALRIFSYVKESVIVPNATLIFAIIFSVPLLAAKRKTLSRFLFTIISFSFITIYIGTYALSLIFSTWDQIGGSATRMAMFLTPLILYYLATVLFDDNKKINLKTIFPRFTTKSTSIIDRELSELKHFDQMAESYEHNYGYNKPFTIYKMKKKVSIMLSALPRPRDNSNKSQVWLEIGCGTGAYTQIIAARRNNTTIKAIDISPKIINIANKKKPANNIKYSVASAYSLPYKDNTFDVVYGFYILHHLNQQFAINESMRVLKPGGSLYFCEPNIINPIVYFIKKVPFLKNLVGDSPEETGVNPFAINKFLSSFGTAHIVYSEYLPAAIPGLKQQSMKSIDSRIDNNLQKSPLKYFSGSVHIHAFKYKE